MSTNGRSLGQRMAAELRAEMARQDISRRQLSERIGESHVTVGRWVKGDTAMSLDTLDAVCRALGLTIPDLLAAVERNGGYEVSDRSAVKRSVPAQASDTTDVRTESNRGCVGSTRPAGLRPALLALSGSSI